ncbi:unnamed protein product [Spirodela intermedia]|uniref:Photosystem I reaction center subunit VI n=1 Tax=Spirodela intermedia TaxID=51605 RepID=A0A7I8IV23_SPIIN|nr:unnamed protein product [Spirodela intermedia]CAA6661007.1 unnamed protein product [Spirodela intermedia]
MASLTTAAATAVRPVTVKGLGGSSLNGTKLAVKPARRSLPRTNLRSGAVVAKYGEKSVYFDLEDIPTPPASGISTAPMRRPLTILSRFSKFFETFAAPFTKRGLLLKFLILGGGFTLAYFSSTVSGDVLPIKKGPQLPPKLGPRDKI